MRGVCVCVCMCVRARACVTLCVCVAPQPARPPANLPQRHPVLPGERPGRQVGSQRALHARQAVQLRQQRQRRPQAGRRSMERLRGLRGTVYVHTSSVARYMPLDDGR